MPEIELNNKCRYPPHRPVIKLNSQTTKVRPVFDASTSQRGKLSLNECLHKGINLLEMIPDILDRFRMFPIGISADKKKAFLMLSVAPKDRDFLRFPPQVRRDKKFIGIAELFGVCSSPYLLNISLIHLLENYPAEFKEIAQKMKRSFYVDNLVCGVYNTSELEHFIEQEKCIMNKGFFNICGVLKAMLIVKMLTSIQVILQFWE
ncbi:integrase catalytic domain-containing protein [Trichonephila clavipes]|nr:integrase catalytic domain-containing protein [Trichonephila clavipes]